MIQMHETTTLKFLIRVLHYYSFFEFFPTYLALLGPTRLFIFGKNSHLHCFLRDKYEKIPTYMPLLRSTLLLLSEKTSHLQGY